MLRREDDFRVFVVLQNLTVHAPVAAFVTAIPGGGVHYQRATGCASFRIEANSSALQLKRAMYSVQNVAQGEVHMALRRVELEYHVLCACHDRQEWQEQQNCAETGEPL